MTMTPCPRPGATAGPHPPSARRRLLAPGLLALIALAGAGRGAADLISTSGNLVLGLSSGNVCNLTPNGLGIGTTSPSANLHVAGNAVVSGRLGIGTSAPVSTLEVAGSLGYRLEDISSDGAVSGGNAMILVDTASGNVRVSLPAASAIAGRVFTIKNTGANRVTVPSSNSIDGSSTGFRVEAHGRLQLISNGLAWFILDSSSGLAELSATPVLLNARADDPDEGDSVLGAGDTLTLGFDMATNQPSVSTKAAVDALVDFGSRTLGASYTGSWSSANTLVLTLADATGANLGSGNTIAVKYGGGLTNAAGTSDASTSSTTLGGSWGFDPTSLGNVLLWLDGADLDGDQLEEGLSEAGLSGNSVLAWKDKSASGNAAWATAKAAYIPSAQNSHALLRFDGTAYYTFRNLSTIRTVLWVLKEDADATATYRFLLGCTFASDFHRPAAKPFWSGSYAAASVLNGTTTLNGNTIDGQTTNVPTALSICSLVSASDASANQLTQDHGISTRTWDGDIAEVLIFSDALSSYNLLLARNYLERKWRVGVTVVVPALVSASANDPDDGDTVLGNGDTLCLDFNVPISGLSADTKARVDALLDFGAKSLGADYSGTWLTDWRLKITVNDATGGDLAVGDPITLRQDTLGPATGNACNLGGDWGTASFDPTDCGNMLLWVDSSDLDGDGLSEGLSEYGLSGNSISLWTDKTTGVSLTQTVETKRPVYVTAALNGNAVVKFDGANDYLSMSRLTTIRTVFWVLRENAAAGDYIPMLGDSVYCHFHGGGARKFWYGAGASANVTGGSLRVNEVVTDGLNTTKPTAYSVVSLVTTGNVSANEINRDQSIGSRVWYGEIAEIIIYSQPLTDTERTNVYNYLKGKWGL